MNTNPVIPLNETMQREPDSIRVFLHDVCVDLLIGIYSSEMKNPQPIIINVELEALLPHRYQDLSETKLDRVIDYEPIYHFIRRDLPQMGHIYLLETAAEQIVDFCFRDIRIQKARVRLEKTAVFDAASGAGVEISRTRPMTK